MSIEIGSGLDKLSLLLRFNETYIDCEITTLPFRVKSYSG